MSARARIAGAFAARDPGRARLSIATAVSAGMLASAVIAVVITNALHADRALLAMAVFLSVQAGSMVKDRTAAARVVTTALSIPAVALAIAVAAALSAHRPAVIAVFIVVTGAAVWVRKFGPRATTIGSLSFMGYFFTLFMRPTSAELPAFCLIAACAVATQLAARSILLLRRPRREVAVLLKELRSASTAALRAAAHPEHAKTLRSRLARIDDVGRAITSWQRDFRTERHIACQEQALEARVLDARVDTEEVCYELARIARSSDEAPPPSLQDAHAELSAVLDEHAAPTRVAAATSWAEGIIARGVRDHGDGLAVYLMARCTVAHARLRDIDLSRGLTDQTRPAAAPAPHRSKTAPQPAHPHRPRWMPWSQWAPTTRMAVQAMVAASIASIVGEAISASRWYWAVMTAFVVFAGATTRGDILTRAFRRVAGTALGIGVGLVAVAFADHHTAILIAICVVSVFGMLYFGPVNYVYSAIFVTMMLVALYRMLGVLDRSLLELRLVETVSGAVIGVLCAYLIMTVHSRPVLVAKIGAYFDALARLMRSAAAAFGAQEPAAGAARSSAASPSADELIPNLHALEAAQAAVDHALSAMATAFLVTGPRREADAVHLMYIGTRSAARLAQSAADEPSSPAGRDGADVARRAVADAIREVEGSAAEARRILCSPGDDALPTTDESAVLANLDRLPPGSNSGETAAIMALARIDWALRQITGGDPAGRRHRRAPAVTIPPT